MKPMLHCERSFSPTDRNGFILEFRKRHRHWVVLNRVKDLGKISSEKVVRLNASTKLRREWKINWNSACRSFSGNYCIN